MPDCASPIGKGNWKISETLNTSKTFHIIEGLEPGTEYTVRLMINNWVDNSSIFEDVIRTSVKGEEVQQMTCTKTHRLTEAALIIDLITE